MPPVVASGALGTLHLASSSLDALEASSFLQIAGDEVRRTSAAPEPLAPLGLGAEEGFRILMSQER